MASNTLIELTPADALLFIEFQKRHAFMALLDSLGVFNVRNGSVTIHFDSLGQLSTVEKKEIYRPSV